MAYLSRNDIDAISSKIIAQYKRIFVPARHLCYNVDPVKLASVMGLAVDYRCLSTDHSILGMTSSEEVCVSLPGSSDGEFMYFLDGNTVLIEQALTKAPGGLGRLNYTVAHEIGHQIVYRLNRRSSQTNSRSILHYRRKEIKPKIEDWEEWQADSFAAALLMPQDAVRDAMFYFGLGESMKVLSRKYSPNRYDSFCHMADFLGVSKTALSIRLEHLGLLDRNDLLK